MNHDPTWTGSGTESPLPNMPGSVGNSFGQTFYTKNAVFIQSKTLDTGNSSPTYTSIDVVDSKPSGSAITYSFSGSSDNFQNDSTSYVTSDRISELSGKRYLRFKVTMTAGARTSTPEVSRLAINYTEHVQDSFVFGSSTGCAAVHAENSKGGPYSTIFFLLYLIFLPKIVSFFPIHNAKTDQKILGS